MCGITGYCGGKWHTGTEGTERQLLVMADALTSRGPDSYGYWSDSKQTIALAHRRLAVVDLSTTGHQPMLSPSGRYVIAFNGEIYNHLDLREQLAVGGSNRINWQGHSDTETLIVGIEAWGLEDTLKKSVGMFAFALWDREEQVLVLARDRIGEKPLYYGCQKGIFLFGSELKALKAHPAFEGEIDRDAITLQLRHNYIPSPFSIYKGVRKLLPGSFLKLPVRRGLFSVTELPEPTPYWSFVDAIIRGIENPFDGSDSDSVDMLDHLLRESVRHQMLADVPLGAFLSGGVDSSSVVALMQAQSSRPVKTFSIGFDVTGYNEAVYAKAVARHLGSEHTELYVSPQQAMDVIPRLPTLYDEPFSDSSQIPTFLVSEMTRQHVTVSLSGDAADELFGGYNRYLLTSRLWSKLNRLPSAVRCWGETALTALSPDQWNKLLGAVQHFMPPTWRLANLGDKLHKGAGVIGCNSIDSLYLRLVTHWDAPSSLVIGANEPGTLLTAPNTLLSFLGGIERMMALDTMTYLPDDILVKVDRAAMGVSLETRVPFLDHRVVEFAWSLPMSKKIRNGQSKWILRQLLYKYVPKQLIERPKMGFGMPIGSWLRGPLRGWAESMVDESRLRQEGFFNPAPIRKKWNEHLSGQRNWQDHLWDVLMFQAWLEQECVN
jgi:asparagine synthase (glutamine-hydrolysing)